MDLLNKRTRNIVGGRVEVDHTYMAIGRKPRNEYRESGDLMHTYMLGQIKFLVQRPQHGRWIVHIRSMWIAMACMHMPPAAPSYAPINGLAHVHDKVLYIYISTRNLILLLTSCSIKRQLLVLTGGASAGPRGVLAPPSMRNLQG